jgi:putative transposase
MSPVISAALAYLTLWFQSRHAMQMEILALRHQLAVYQHSVKRPQLQPADRLFWAWLSQLWSGWQQVLEFVQALSTYWLISQKRDVSLEIL